MTNAERKSLGAKHAVTSVMKRNTLVSVGTIAAILAGIYLLASSYPVYHPIPFDTIKFRSAVEWMQSNANTAQGAVKLPPNFASVSADGKAYVTDGMIFFPSLIGRRTLLPNPFDDENGWMEGYGFSTEPLPAEDSEAAGSSNFFFMMDLSDPHSSDSNGFSGREMAVDTQFAPHWYKIDSFS